MKLKVKRGEPVKAQPVPQAVAPTPTEDVQTTHQIKADCVGAGGRGGLCTILTETLCVTCGKCSFYKTKEQSYEARRKSYLRRCKHGGPFTSFDSGFMTAASLNKYAKYDKRDTPDE